jgi:hypothetical protein
LWFTKEFEPSLPLRSIADLFVQALVRKSTAHRFPTLQSGSLSEGRLPSPFCFRNGIEKVEKSFSVGEFVDPLYLQASIFVGDNVCGEDRFEVEIQAH